MKSNILSDIQHFFTQECGLDIKSLGTQQALFTSNLVDSLDVFRLIAFLEKHFLIKLNAFELSLEKLDTLERISKLVEEKTAA